MKFPCPACNSLNQVLQRSDDGVRLRKCLQCGERFHTVVTETLLRPKEPLAPVKPDKPMTKAQQLDYVDSFNHPVGAHPALDAPYGQSPPVQGDPYQMMARQSPHGYMYEDYLADGGFQSIELWIAAACPTGPNWRG